MIVGVVSCPQPPLLLPGATGRPVPEVERLRAACLAAIADLLAGRLDSVLLVGGVPPAGGTGPAEVTGPVKAEVTGAVKAEVAAPAEPLSLRLGRVLLAEAGCPVPIRPVPIPANAPAGDCLATGRELAADPTPGQRLGLLVMADGSARRGPKAPGYLDPRAAPFDQAVERALTTGDPAGLAALDEQVAAELLVAGRAAWQVLAGATEGRRPQVRTYYLGDPFGVWYPVVGWHSIDQASS